MSSIHTGYISPQGVGVSYLFNCQLPTHRLGRGNVFQGNPSASLPWRCYPSGATLGMSAMEGTAAGGQDDHENSKAVQVDHFERLPDDIWANIMNRVPHLMRLHSRCVSSQWNAFLRKREAEASRSGAVWCLLIEAASNLRVGSHLRCQAMAPPDERVILPLTMHGLRLRHLGSGWPRLGTSEAGGLRSGGGLVALSVQGCYRVGNPVHDRWEPVQEPAGSAFESVYGQSRFELVVTPASDCAASCFEIVQFSARGEEVEQSLNTQQGVRHVSTFVFTTQIQVYSSRTRRWRTGLAGHDTTLFDAKCLLHHCVFGRMVYFLKYLPALQATMDASIDPAGWIDPDPERPEVNPDRSAFHHNRVEVWGYDLDTDRLDVVVPTAPVYGPGRVFEFDRAAYRAVNSLQLHVRHRTGMEGCGHARGHHFSIIAACASAGLRNSGPGGTQLLRRLLLDEEDPERRFWYVQDTVDVADLAGRGSGSRGAPHKAAVVANTWGLSFVAYDVRKQRYIPPIDWPITTQMQVLCYHRDNEAWTKWLVDRPYPKRSSTELVTNMAVQFEPCECIN